MATCHLVTRRTLLIGGISVALVGCRQEGGGDGGSGASTSAFRLPTWAEVPMYLTMATLVAPIGGFFAGAIGLTRLAAGLRWIGWGADKANLALDGVQLLNQIRWDRFALPTPNSSPKPFIVPEDDNINDFESVPVFRNNLSLHFGVLNEEGANFGEYDIYATVKRVDERPPQTLSDIFGSAELPHFIVSPAPNGNWDRKVDIGELPSGAFVSYSWRVPRGQQPSDDYIASTAFIGPAFLSIGGDNSIDLAEVVDSGKNVEARFQLPDANLV